jgi:hypothetical protein
VTILETTSARKQEVVPPCGTIPTKKQHFCPFKKALVTSLVTTSARKQEVFPPCGTIPTQNQLFGPFKTSLVTGLVTFLQEFIKDVPLK